MAMDPEVDAEADGGGIGGGGLSSGQLNVKGAVPQPVFRRRNRNKQGAGGVSKKGGGKKGNKACTRHQRRSYYIPFSIHNTYLFLVVAACF